VIPSPTARLPPTHCPRPFTCNHFPAFFSFISRAGRVPLAKFEYGAVAEWSSDFVNQDTLSAFAAQQLAKHARRAAGGSVCAVIPARFASVRFPGKMMADLIGKSMIQRTFERVRASAAVAQVFLTTESEELASHARSFTPNVIISSESPKNGMYEPPFYIFSAASLLQP
jgi:hypothetical protein